MHFYIHTFGCRVNSAESTKLATELLTFGFQETDLKQTDLLIINSCAVTQKAVRELRQFINQARSQNPQAVIYLTGCAATLWQKTSILPGQINIITNFKKNKLSQIIAQKFNRSKIHVKSDKPWGKFLQSSRLMVKVQDGCDYFCTYCIVPYLRGLSVSYEPDTIIEYINSAIRKNPINEVILTGINLGLYKTKDQQDFANLIEQVLKQTTVPKISFGSLYTENLNQGFFNLYQSVSAFRLTRYFHIPVQSGSNKILGLMKRRYNLEEFSDRVNQLAKTVPDALLATDVIVGFLEESEQNFKETYQYLCQSPFVRAHIFKYSKREFTAGYYLAKRLRDPSETEKTKRSKILHELFIKKMAVFQSNLLGQTKRALIINRKADYALGFLDNGLEIIIPGGGQLANGFVNVQIEQVKQAKIIARLA